MVTDEQTKSIDGVASVASFATHELMTSEAWRHITSHPVLDMALRFTSIHLSGRERENGPSADQCNDYFHAVRTAKIAYDLGFDDRVVMLTLLHDYINPKHADSRDRIGELNEFLYQTDLSSIGMNPDSFMDELIKIEYVEKLSKEKTRGVPIFTVAGLFIPEKISDPDEYEKVIETLGVSPFIVNICEAIDNLQYPKSSNTPRPLDLIEGSSNIFQPDLLRINELRQDRMVDDVVRIFRYYLPLLEASGHSEAIREIKDRAIQILAPLCFNRVHRSMSEIRDQEQTKVQQIFDHLTGLVSAGTEKKLNGRTMQLTSPFLKGTGSTVIKMLLYGQERPELGGALSKARGEEEVEMAITNILDQMRDLIRCRIILPEDTRAELGAVFVPAVNKIVREVKKGGNEMGFSKTDLDAGEAVQIYMNPERIVHARKVGTELGELASGMTIKSKPNGYEGVNIAIRYNGGQRFELQMLTIPMSVRNEYGEASHAGFKSGILGKNVSKHSASVQSFLRPKS